MFLPIIPFIVYCSCEYSFIYMLLHIGTVHVSLKDSIFEASSPTRHTTELGRRMKKMFPNAVAVVMYTDGEPHHNCKHMSVRLGLLALFLELDLDTMVAMRTTPTDRWGNPIERVMSVLNLGLQDVALARDEMDNDLYEKYSKKCNGMSVARKIAEAYEGVVVDDTTVVEKNLEGCVAMIDQQNTEADDNWLHMQQQLLEEEEKLSMLVHTKTEDDHLEPSYQPC